MGGGVAYSGCDNVVNEVSARFLEGSGEVWDDFQPYVPIRTFPSKRLHPEMGRSTTMWH